MRYGGYVSLECVPTPDTVSSLEWMGRLGFSL